MADRLCLAATPTFAAMALVEALFGGQANILCGAGGGLPLNGMALMYALMSIFHAAPWLRRFRRA
ncbi:hypothetical protein [Oleomonas cavernae]|nr:hypothetical protein [Oleomonas cavernae]